MLTIVSIIFLLGIKFGKIRAIPVRYTVAQLCQDKNLGIMSLAFASIIFHLRSVFDAFKLDRPPLPLHSSYGIIGIMFVYTLQIRRCLVRHCDAICTTTCTKCNILPHAYTPTYSNPHMA